MHPQESKELFLQILEKLNNPPPLYALPENRIVRLEPGFQYIHQLPVKNPEENNSAIYYLIQIGAPQTSIDIKLDLLDLIGSEPAFDTLRTKEQLGVRMPLFSRDSALVSQALTRADHSRRPPVYCVVRRAQAPRYPVVLRSYPIIVA